jgi:hypothetical protein
MPPLRERCVPPFLASNDLVKGAREGKGRLSGPLPAGSDILGTKSHNNNNNNDNICVLFTDWPRRFPGVLLMPLTE